MKKIICLLLCVVTVFSLTACGLLGNKEDTKPTDSNNTVTTQPTENNGGSETTDKTPPVADAGNYKEGSVEHTAITFINSLIVEDYEKALRCFNVPAETPYFTADDIKWYLPRSNYADVTDVDYEAYAVSVDTNKHDSENATCVVTISDTSSDKSKTFTLKMVLDNTNKWGVKDNDFYLDEYYVVAPGGKTALTINGKEAPTYDSKFGTTQYQYLYKLTYVGKSEKNLKVSHDNFTDEEKVFPVENTKDEPYKIVAAYEDEAALTAMKDIWMAFNQAAVDKKAYSEMIHLLSPSANTELAKSCMDGMTEMLDNGKCKDFAITKMTYAPMKEGQETKWLASDKLQICFNYTLNWIYTGALGGPEDMNNHEIIILHYDGEKFTLDTIIQNRIFVHRDDWRNDYLQ